MKNKFLGTDESMLVQRISNQEINIVEGSVFNFKVTSKEDIFLFSKLVTGTFS
jgi:2-C-methyl-D-erythritol 4-phosphate cytidylyltransferase